MQSYQNDFYLKLKEEFEVLLNRKLTDKEKEFLLWLASKKALF
ncbi:hypothetical protein [Aquibacillus albus]|uniref:Uncharacterized protein n=1 Tax=Aquibacillus albus TaxID=1168171 RepID=A0ABS2MVN0_9BACI|nr:hypothetical protein [Aquibacillus albus]MBM7569959.1 hypothetical protein [Aquibacillus albus]